MTVDTGLWYKRPKYEDVVKAIERDYKVKLPERTALQFWDSFALSQYRDQVAELQGGRRLAMTTRPWKPACSRRLRSRA